MILKKGSIADFAQRVKTAGKKIIVYGAGVIGQVIAPYWLELHQIDDRVLCYVDADHYKQGQDFWLNSRNVPIRSLAALEKECGCYILLIAVSAFEPVVRGLEQLPGTENLEVYFLPIMLLDIANTPRKDCVFKSGEMELIPRKIHYCWFSGDPIPNELIRCIDSWKQFCPDYEIVRWDESNYDVGKSPYMEQAYAQKKWSFVSDFARLDILYQHGGIYLDTDVELVRSFDELLYQRAFCGVESWGTVNTGGGVGATKRNPVIKKMLDFRKDVYFLNEDGSPNQVSCGYYETLPLIPLGLHLNGTTQVIADGMMTVYSADYFHPFDYMSGMINITKNTFSIHRFNGSWMGAQGIHERNQTRDRYTKFLNSLEE